MHAIDATGRAATAKLALGMTADCFRQQVNEVTASGQGGIAMAFVEDEIGNWNLKSFSNDPCALLAAYRGAATASVGVARQLLGLANQLATGETAASTGGPGPTVLHERALAKLVARRATFETRQAALRAERVEADNAAQATLGTGRVESPKKAAEAAGAALDARADDARTAAEDVLDDQLAVIAALQKAATGPTNAAQATS